MYKWREGDRVGMGEGMNGGREVEEEEEKE